MALNTGPGFNISGAWKSTDGWRVQIKQIGNQLTGTYSGQGGVTGTLSGTFDGEQFAGTYQTHDSAGRLVASGTQTLILNGNSLEGPWSSSDGRQGMWTLVRAR